VAENIIFLLFPRKGQRSCKGAAIKASSEISELDFNNLSGPVINSPIV
jgi:hypothetical protein